MFKTILFPIKKTEKVNRVLEMASFLLMFGTEKIIVLNVGRNQETSRFQALARIVDALREQGYETDLVFRQGHVPTQIVRTGMETEASFLCLPWKRKNPVRRAITGNVVSDVIRLSNQPVLVHKSVKVFGFKRGMNNVLYATDLMKTDIKILHYLTHEGLKADNLFLFHAGQRAPDPLAEKRRAERTREKMAVIEQMCNGAFNKIEKSETTGGAISSTIARKARRKRADLIIIGKADKVKPIEKMAGSVAESLPNKSHCSLMVVPGAYHAINNLKKD